MKISSKGEYALRLMLDLALHNTGEYITIKSIASRQEMPEKYLEQIIAVLSRNGFVKSGRGSKGGYQLAYAPNSITVGMILRAIEGSLAPVACLDSGIRECPHEQGCVTLSIWSELYNAINQVVDGITLEEMVRRYYNINAANNYVI